MNIESIESSLPLTCTGTSAKRERHDIIGSIRKGKAAGNVKQSTVGKRVSGFEDRNAVEIDCFSQRESHVAIVIEIDVFDGFGDVRGVIKNAFAVENQDAEGIGIFADIESGSAQA